MSDHTTRADHGIIPYGHTRQNNRATADPHILTDMDRAPKLDARPAKRWITWMVCRIYLGCWANLGSRSDSHGNDIKHNAIEIQKHVRPDPDIVAVVAIKRRSDDHVISDLR